MSQSLIGRRILIPRHFAEPVVIEGAEDYGDMVTLRGERKDASPAAGPSRSAVSSKCSPRRATSDESRVANVLLVTKVANSADRNKW